jgi:hypothetical protein
LEIIAAVVGTQGTPSSGEVMWGEIGGGCAGGRGRTTIKIVCAMGVRLVDFGPGPGAPSLQVNLVAPGELVEEVAMSVWDGGVGDGHSIKVAGQQSQSILSSICLIVRPLCSANAMYTLDGIVEGEPQRSFHHLLFGIRDGVLCCDTILEVPLKEDRHGKEITSVSCVALFTAGFTGDARLIGARDLVSASR